MPFFFACSIASFVESVYVCSAFKMVPSISRNKIRYVMLVSFCFEVFLSHFSTRKWGRTETTIRIGGCIRIVCAKHFLLTVLIHYNERFNRKRPSNQPIKEGETKWIMEYFRFYRRFWRSF